MDPQGRSFSRPVLQFVSNHHDTYEFISLSKANLSGQSVFITGASKGVGRVTAIRFAMAGCSKIAIAARSSLESLSEAIRQAAQKSGHPPLQVLALELDVASEASVKAAAEAVSAAFGGVLDILINNAGYLENWVPVAEADPTSWWRSWEVNINGTFLCCHYLLPLLLRSPTKVLVNMSSAGAHNTSHGASAYQTAKFAVCRLSEHIERENREEGLVVVALHPGGVKTELALNMPEAMHAILIDEPELAADTMVWIGDNAPRWLSGRFVSATWDLEELGRRKDEIVARDLLKFRMVI